MKILNILFFGFPYFRLIFNLAAFSRFAALPLPPTRNLLLLS